MNITNEERDILTKAMAIMNGLLFEEKVVKDFENEGVYQFVRSNINAARFVQGFCKQNDLEVYIEQRPQYDEYFVQVRYTMNSELLALQKLDKDIN